MSLFVEEYKKNYKMIHDYKCGEIQTKSLFMIFDFVFVEFGRRKSRSSDINWRIYETLDKISYFKNDEKVSV
jgi:hypothetical protein